MGYPKMDGQISDQTQIIINFGPNETLGEQNKSHQSALKAAEDVDALEKERQ